MNQSASLYFAHAALLTLPTDMSGSEAIQHWERSSCEDALGGSLTLNKRAPLFLHDRRVTAFSNCFPKQRKCVQSPNNLHSCSEVIRLPGRKGQVWGGVRGYGNRFPSGCCG